MKLESRYEFRLRAAATLGFIGLLLIGVVAWRQRATTQGLLVKQQSGDQWAFWNSKRIQRFQFQTAADLLRAVRPESTAELAAYATEIHKSDMQAQQAQAQAHGLDTLGDAIERRVQRLSIAAVLLEFAIVLCAMAIAAQGERFLLTALLIALIASALGFSTLLI
jgi:Domain of unknown function (DUF4337)